MKKWVLGLLSVLLVLTTAISVVQAENTDYEKWGKIAIQLAKENYPEAEISDYQYQGREEISDTEAKDTFHFTAKQDNKSIDIYVALTFNPKTKQLKSVNIEEKKQ
ncbi:YqzG/YhdC family protein [Bacillus tianshenii]|uniref:DUF3889 domain-containing protein n=1 Tax=Sutcliffiella tianshenii TaxID=1463404 RepID=UPI001CD321CF|nr:DUF3889 domain-containing protein [Bacillus tianshenii]MCA1321454.1 YqzG/YhdC family protein [Bacillus tianshenii]